MNKDNAFKIIQASIDRGADFAEIYIEETRNSVVTLQDRRVESATAGTDYGIGIRLFFGTDVLYAYSCNDETDHLINLVNDLTRTRQNERQINSTSAVYPVSLSLPDIHQILKNPKTVGQSPKLEFLKLADARARAISPRITQVGVNAMDSTKEIAICNSEGIWAEDRRIRTRLTISVTAEEGNLRFSANESPGALQGFEFLENLNIQELAESAARRALLMLGAGYIEGRKMPVILGNGFGGVIFHEACGHPLETEAIRKKASPFTDRIGKIIAHPAITAIDDGTIVNSWGSLIIDDEGYPTDKTVLIDRGVLVNFMSDRIGASETGVPRTGNGRRESYRYAPVSRMRNTYIDRGKDSFDDMLVGIDYGLYAKKLGGGSVNPATGEFNFAVEEGYVIRKGKVAEPVRGATLTGQGDDILPKISMVGKDLEHAAGMCGASSGTVPVTVGQPTIKVDEILVGGR